MTIRTASKSIAWLTEAIKSLPADESVPKGTQGFNVYQTQKEHWLGWLDPSAGTGTYPRQNNDERDARDVYNRIVEPKMLVWLATAAKVELTLLHTAIAAANASEKMPSKSAAIRKYIPWAVVEAALALQQENNAAKA
jgi:hypothetical protein